MCGISGFFDERPATRASREAVVSAMTDSLRHRGPDDSGSWIDAEAGIALGHRRLAIIDVSAGGHQPMATANGRYVIVFNGEIYNYRDVAERLRQSGAALRSRSDTEVLIEGFARWGIVPTLAECEGMFAFALWDRARRELTLARDRLGIKPLYWGRAGRAFVFGSELKALRRHPEWRGEIDPDAVAAYLRFGYVPAPMSIYRGVHKLEPGTILTLRAGGEAQLERYWDLMAVAATARRDPLAESEGELLDELEGVLRRAVRNEMVADVPLGAFLSGGVDSSLVTALMQAESARPVKTFTIGFTAEGYDEARHAKEVAAHLGTEHTELYVEEREAREAIPHLPTWYDEPFADSSQIPTQIVSRLARRHVTVALSGDGGDELFAGYTRYQWGENVRRAFALAPRPLRQGAAAVLDAHPGDVLRGLSRLTPARLRLSHPEQKAAKLAGLLREKDLDAAYRRLVSLWPEPERLLRSGREPRGLLQDSELRRAFPNFVERMMLLDTLTYLPDDILTKVDRASMSVALEARVPLLNHRVVEFAWRLPPTMKLRQGMTKWALRRILERHVPRALIERPKQGFAVPLAAWLRGPLRGWADDLLSRDALVAGYLDADTVVARWREHRSGARDWSAGLWAVLMFQSWIAEAGVAGEVPEVRARGSGDQSSSASSWRGR